MQVKNRIDFYLTFFYNSISMERIQTRSMILIPLFAGLTAIGGFLRIPFFPVPLTLQTLFVYLSGDLLGGKDAMISQLLFLTVGLIGVPIFALGGGWSYIFQPTFGYLLGFPIAAWIIGTWVDKKELSSWIRLIWVNSTGLFVIYLLGVIYLYINMNIMTGHFFPWSKAVWFGALLLFPGEIIKLVLSVSIAIKIKPILCHS